MQRPSSDPRPTIAAPVLARLLHYARARSIDAEAVCRSLNVDPAIFSRADARVSYVVAEAIGTRIEALSGDANFGLHLGQQVTDAIERDPGVLAMMASATVRDAIEKLLRMQRLWGDGERASASFCDDGALRYQWRSIASTDPSRRHADECAMAEFVAGLRALAGDSLAPRVVRFRHEAPSDRSEHDAFFRCPLEFDRSHTGLELDRATLDAAMPHASERFEQVFLRQVERSLAALPTEQTFVDRVRAAIRETILRCSLDVVASALSMSQRSVQRRLRDEGTTFADVHDDVRREVALELLERGEAIVSVAQSVGYRDAPAFFHAFKRWTGTTPEQARAARLAK
ncbi:MAG: AraC family transcriptional regulator [Polyangiales bacterium]